MFQRQPISIDPSRVVGMVLVGCLVLIPGCTEGDECAAAFYVFGTLLDADAGTGIVDATVAGQAFTNGERTGFRSGRIPPTSGLLPEPAEDGSFELVFNTFDQFPCPPHGPRPFPRPDQIEVIVVRDGCVQRVVIEVNEDTAFDIDSGFGNVDIIELKDPILVAPCGANQSGP